MILVLLLLFLLYIIILGNRLAVGDGRSEIWLLLIWKAKLDWLLYSALTILWLFIFIGSEDHILLNPHLIQLTLDLPQKEK